MIERTVKTQDESLASPDARRKTTTMREVLKATHEDPFGLLDARVELTAYPLPNGNLYTAHFPGTAFFGQELLNVLTYARPAYITASAPEPQTTSEVLDDWAVKDFELDPDNKRQFRFHHKHFEPHWTELHESHLWQYRRGLGALSKEEKEMLLTHDVNRFMPLSNAVRLLPELLTAVFDRSNIYDLVSHGNRIIHKLMQHALYEEVRTLDTQGLLSKIRWPENFFPLLIGFFDSLPQAYKEDLLRDGVFPSNVPIFDDTGPVDGEAIDWDKGAFMESEFVEFEKFLGRDGYYEYNAVRETKDTYRLGFPDSYARFRMVGDEKEILEWQVRDSDEMGLSPQLVWQTSDGKRTYQSRDIPDFVTDGVDPRVSPNFGLVIAHALPADRVRLPTEIRGKQIGESQLPLFVLMYRNQIMQNGVFQAIEKTMAA